MLKGRKAYPKKYPERLSLALGIYFQRNLRLHAMQNYMQIQ